ncbi:MAG: PfkB family carbohydrate kinase [Solirubrobacteraceae bacterium]
MNVAVIGHVEWVQFAHVEAVPRRGEVVHASEPFAEPAGGGAVAAVQLARLAGSCTLYTELGDDDAGRASRARLAGLGVEVRAASSQEPTRRAVTLIDEGNERTIVTLGRRLEPAAAEGGLDWSALRELDALYFTAGDRHALELARANARVLVASPRARHALGGGVPLDALVLSADDEIELREADRAAGEAAVVVYTEGAGGGRWIEQGGGEGRWQAMPAPAPAGAPRPDSYGCGDSFAAGLTYGLGAGFGLEDALELAARCGAECTAGQGPYGRQLHLKG